MSDQRTRSREWERCYLVSIEDASSLALRLIAAEAALFAAMDHRSDADLELVDQQYHAVRDALQDALERVEYYNNDRARDIYVNAL